MNVRLLPTLLLLTGAVPLAAQERELAHSILKELIEINTAEISGDMTRAAEAMAARFRAAGFPEQDIQVLIPTPRKGNLVVRLRANNSTLKPILFIGHLDVVEAKREDWTFDPFQLVEKDGFFYGRGTQDMKSDDALLVTTFIRLKQEGFKPGRDLILALTSDEEVGNDNGVQWLLKQHRDLIDAEFCINADSGGGEMKSGRRLFMGIQAAEKTYATFHLDVRNKGGHSSLPVKDNAIYELAAALSRLERFEFPVRLNQVSRSFFERLSAISNGQLAEDLSAVTRTPPDPAAVERLSRESYYNALLRTTCIPTELRGGHSENALPQLAEATVNCRLVPDDTPDYVEKTLARIVADPKVEIKPTQEIGPSPFSTLRADVLNTAAAATNAVWPGLRVIPLMETGATDSKWTRIAGIPSYGLSAMFTDVDDIRAHGKDERAPQQAFYEGIRFDYELIKRLGQPAEHPVR